MYDYSPTFRRAPGFDLYYYEKFKYFARDLVTIERIAKMCRELNSFWFLRTFVHRKDNECAMRIFFEFFFFRFLIFVSFEVEEWPFKFSDTCSRTFGTERHGHTYIKLYTRLYKKNDKAYLPRINLHKYFAKRNASLHESHMLFLTRYELHVTAVYYTTAEIKLKSVLICTMGHVRSVKGTGRSDAAKFFTLIACLRYKLSR